MRPAGRLDHRGVLAQEPGLGLDEDGRRPGGEADRPTGRQFAQLGHGEDGLLLHGAGPLAGASPGGLAGDDLLVGSDQVADPAQKLVVIDVYGTARSLMGFLRNRAMASWITPPPASARLRQFHPAEFTRSRDTLYPLSREGEGSAGPLVAALTVAVIDALEELATASPGGRLTIPFLAVLDEAANICRFRNLDSYYSRFGSRGIIIETILQNWAQGEEVWGVKGMEKLWSAANGKIYGGGEFEIGRELVNSPGPGGVFGVREPHSPISIPLGPVYVGEVTRAVATAFSRGRADWRRAR